MKYNLTLLFLIGFLCLNAGNTTIIYLDEYNFETEVPKLKMISIELGDTVKWVSTKNPFRIDGRYDHYPNNPSEIYSSDSYAYQYEFVFNKSGDYGYECFDHNENLFYLGIISVTENLLENDMNEYALELRSNPFDQSLELTCHNKVNEIEVFNEHGDLVTAQLFKSESEERKIDLSHIHPGPHLIRMITDSGVYIKRVIKK